MRGLSTVGPGEDFLEGFREHLRSEGASFRTRAAYCTDVRDFLHHCGTSPLEAGASDLDQYISAQAGSGIRPSTVRRRLAGLRSYFEYLVTSGARGENPTRDLVMEANGEGALTEKCILSVFRYLRLRSRRVPPRRAWAEELAVMLMIFAGLRQSHFPKLSASSFEARNGFVQLKLGGKETVDIDGPLLGHLRAYRHRYEKAPGPFLVSSKGARRLLAEIGNGLGLELDPRRIHRTSLWLRSDPERACTLLSRIEDIHE